MLKFDRKQQNSVKQLSFNKKNKLKKKKNASILLLCAPLYQRIWHLSETGVPREGGVGARKGGVEELIPLWHIFISGFCFEKKKKSSSESVSHSVLSDSCDSLDYSQPGSSVHGILQASILKWVAIPFSRGSSQLRD